MPCGWRPLPHGREMSPPPTNLEESSLSDEAARSLALELYREDQVSLGRAAELCQKPLAAFMDFAAKHGVRPLLYSLRTSRKNASLLIVSNPDRRNWSPFSCQT